MSALDKIDNIVKPYFYWPKKGEWRKKDVARIMSLFAGGALIGGTALLFNKGVKALHQRVKSREIPNSQSVIFSHSKEEHAVEGITNLLRSSQALNLLEISAQDLQIELRPALSNQAIRNFVISKLIHTFANQYVDIQQAGDDNFTRLVQCLKTASERPSKELEEKIFNLMKVLYRSGGFKYTAPDEYERLSEYVEFCFTGEKITPLTPPVEERKSRYCKAISRALINQMVEWVIKEEDMAIRMAAKSLLDHLINPFTLWLFENMTFENRDFQSACRQLEEMEERLSQTESDQSRLSVS